MILKIKKIISELLILSTFIFPLQNFSVNYPDLNKLYYKLKNAESKKLQNFFIAKIAEESLKFNFEKDMAKIFDYDHLVSLSTYSDNWIEKILPTRDLINPGNCKLMYLIKEKINFSNRNKLIQKLLEYDYEKIDICKQFFPLEKNAKLQDYSDLQYSHFDAIDVFANIGTQVYAYMGGLILHTDKKWKKDEEFSSSSYYSGNHIIIFNPFKKEFHRYAHLEKILVNEGEMVNAGEKIGTVGITGKIANTIPDKSHLHFSSTYLNENGKLVYKNIYELWNEFTFLKNQ